MNVMRSSDRIRVIALNRFTSLLAGLTATMLACWWLDLRWLRSHEVAAFIVIMIGFGFLFWGAIRRKNEEATEA